MSGFRLQSNLAPRLRQLNRREAIRSVLLRGEDLTILCRAVFVATSDRFIKDYK